uniref:Uncharacterized protein n=1 Tax=Sphaerodactylus townsendi TaxID=933632 RepID=A0ACB8EQE9_9SAUR
MLLQELLKIVDYELGFFLGPLMNLKKSSLILAHILILKDQDMIVTTPQLHSLQWMMFSLHKTPYHTRLS